MCASCPRSTPPANNGDEEARAFDALARRYAHDRRMKLLQVSEVLRKSTSLRHR